MMTERIEHRIEPEPNSGCWIWIGARDQDGYGRTDRMPGTRLAHRVIYQSLVGPIPEGLTIDHLCRVRCCVNPGHLEPVAHGINTLRGATVTAVNAAKTHCIYGHPFTPKNTYRRSNGNRRCRMCLNAAVRRYQRRLRAARKKSL